MKQLIAWPVGSLRPKNLQRAMRGLPFEYSCEVSQLVFVDSPSKEAIHKERIALLNRMSVTKMSKLRSSNE